MKSFAAALALAASLAAGAAHAQPAQTPPPAAAAPAPAGAALTVDSKVGQLIADPRTDAVLKAQIPEARNNDMFSTAGADLSLREIAAFEPSITADKLQTLVLELAKAQAKP